MKKTVFISVLMLCGMLHATDFTFNGVPFGARRGSFPETRQLAFGELNFKNITYAYENDILTETTAERARRHRRRAKRTLPCRLC